MGLYSTIFDLGSVYCIFRQLILLYESLEDFHGAVYVYPKINISIVTSLKNRLVVILLNYKTRFSSRVQRLA